MSDKPTILFACTHNAGRSQIAAGYARALGGGTVTVLSAGPEPGERLSSSAIEVMREDGIDISTQLPRLLQPDEVRAADVVITMGCGDACPVFPGKRYEDWVLDDLAGLDVDAVRGVRDSIRFRVETLLRDLGVSS